MPCSSSHVVHLGGVDEVHAVLHREVELRVRLRLAVLLAESHRAEPQCRHLQVACAQLPVFGELLTSERKRALGFLIETYNDPARQAAIGASNIARGYVQAQGRLE